MTFWASQNDVQILPRYSLRNSGRLSHQNACRESWCPTCQATLHRHNCSKTRSSKEFLLPNLECSSTECYSDRLQDDKVWHRAPHTCQHQTNQWQSCRSRRRQENIPSSSREGEPTHRTLPDRAEYPVNGPSRRHLETLPLPHIDKLCTRLSLTGSFYH